MIQPESLRIGNWLNKKSVVNRDGKMTEVYIPVKVDIYILGEILNGNKLGIYSGIPLTEEVLVKAGFERRASSTCTQWHIGLNEITHDWLFSLTWLECPVLVNAPDAPFFLNGRHTIYFVHELQNLYYALTKQELTIEL